MKVLSSATGSAWVTLSNPGVASEHVQDIEESTSRSAHVRENLVADLTGLLYSEHLVVLTGLGTSLCVQTEQGERAAPTMWDLWTAAESSNADEFALVQKQVNFPEAAVGNLELLLSHCQLSQSLRPDPTVGAFLERTEQLIVKRCRFLESKKRLPVHEAFLRKCARRSTRQSRLKLFTTNYDTCFETAATNTRFVVVDGFSHTVPQTFDGGYFALDLVRRGPNGGVPDYVPNVFHLYKLHGSVDWELVEGDVVRNPTSSRPLLVYPQYGKFESSYSQPFIELMSRYQFELRQENVGIVVIGMGFNDYHISQPLMAAIRSNVACKLVVIDPSLEDSENSCVVELKSLIRGGDSRLTLLSGKFEDFVPLLPDLVAQTETERHAERVQVHRVVSR